VLCPRCQQPTHVIDSRMQNQLVRRRRSCGHRRGEQIVSCGYQFYTMEIPAGARVSFVLEARVGTAGLEAEVKKT